MTKLPLGELRAATDPVWSEIEKLRADNAAMLTALREIKRNAATYQRGQIHNVADAAIAAATRVECCTYPRCKCIVGTSTTKPEPDCPRGLERPD